jgi:lysophospholipase
MAQQRRRTAPTGGHTETLTPPSGGYLRAMIWPIGWRGTVLLLHGRREFCEKHFETVADLQDRGFAVATLDWRGQGLSERLLLDRQRGHIVDFDTYVNDLTYFFGHVREHLPKPYRLLAHSMGGHIALRFLADRLPEVAGAVVVAPMTGIVLKPLPQGLAKAIVAAACRLGLSGAYAPGQGPYTEADRRKEADILTSDEDRMQDEILACRNNPDLALGGVTYGWLNAAFQSIRRLHRPGYVERIAAPVLAVLGGADQVVVNDDTRRLMTRLVRGRIVEIPGARHEILKEADPFRDAFWQAFDEFVA